MTRYASRLEKLRELVLGKECDAFFSVSTATNQYLSGFQTSFGEISSAVLVTPHEALFLCDSRYIEQAQDQVQDLKVEQIDNKLLAVSGARFNDLGAKKVAFDPNDLTLEEFHDVEGAFEGVFVETPKLAMALRQIKDPEEVACIRAASRLAEGVLSDLIEELEPGMSERELAARFEYEFKKGGATGASFDTIALFGSRSSLCHGVPGDRRLEMGDIVLLDFGCRLDGYCSDLTRTFSYGTITDAWFPEIYELVLAAQQAALDALKPGISCRGLDAEGRTVIADAGHSDHFGHGLGHGVGIEIHEAPWLSKHSDETLEPGMIVTVEPGIYVPGKGGVRIEDIAVVTEDGCEVLSTTPKELRVLG